MILSKKRVFITLSIATLITIIYIASSVYNKTFERMDDIVQFVAVNNGTENLYGLTDNGKIYSYNHKKRKVETLVDKSDIIFMKIGSQSLIIHKDGSIYVDKTGGFEGELIGKIEGAVSGDTISSHTAILTDKGHLYMYGYNERGRDEYNILGTDKNHKLDQLTLIELPEAIVKVDCGTEYTALLSEEGKLYTTGRFGLEKNSIFTENVQEEVIVDLQSNKQSVYALKTNGEIVRVNNYHAEDFSVSEFREVENEVFVSLSVAAVNGLCVNSEGELFYWGRDIYKPDVRDSHRAKKMDGISNAEEVYCVGFYAYVIQSDKIICVPLERQNKIVRFINYYNIFYPHYKG